jgi:hypothetical protein
MLSQRFEILRLNADDPSARTVNIRDQEERDGDQ